MGEDENNNTLFMKEKLSTKKRKYWTYLASTLLALQLEASVGVVLGIGRVHNRIPNQNISVLKLFYHNTLQYWGIFQYFVMLYSTLRSTICTWNMVKIRKGMKDKEKGIKWWLQSEPQTVHQAEPATDWYVCTWHISLFQISSSFQMFLTYTHNSRNYHLIYHTFLHVPQIFSHLLFQILCTRKAHPSTQQGFQTHFPLTSAVWSPLFNIFSQVTESTSCCFSSMRPLLPQGTISQNRQH